MKMKTHTLLLAIFLGCLSQIALAQNINTYQAEAITQGDYKQAEAELLQILSSSPNDPFALLNLAVVYHKNGESEKARPANRFPKAALLALSTIVVFELLCL